MSMSDTYSGFNYLRKLNEFPFMVQGQKSEVCEILFSNEGRGISQNQVQLTELRLEGSKEIVESMAVGLY